jgi:cell division septal protein FtsQ
MSATRTPARPARSRASTTGRRARPPMDARIRARRAEVRRGQLRRRRRAIGGVLIAVLVAAGAAGITRSPLFAITAVEVHGVSGAQAEQVLAVAQIATGQNLMTADLDAAVQRTGAIPWVAGAQARREPPSTVVLEVTRRRPAAVVTSDGGSWIVDPGGVVITAGDRRNLPRIALTVAVAPEPGQQLADAAALNALELHRGLPRDVRQAVLALEAVGARTVRAELALAELEDPAGFKPSRRVWVRMGSAGDVAEQVTVLRALLGQRRGDGLPLPTEIDVRVPGNPVIVP